MNQPNEDKGNTALLERGPTSAHAPQASTPRADNAAGRGSARRPLRKAAATPSPLRQHRVAIGVGILLIALFITGIVKLSGGKRSAPKREQMVVVTLPPPPPPPPVQPPPEPKIVEQQQTFQPEEQPQEQPPEPPDAPPLGTNITGDGKGDSFGLSGNGNGRLGGNNSAGTKFGWYAGQVQSRVQQALQQNPRTRSANLRVQVRIWPDRTGRVTRAELVGSSGDPAIDAALQNEILSGLQLQQPPPEGMPVPIVMRLTARRP